jgi:hypothetical protein
MTANRNYAGSADQNQSDDFNFFRSVVRGIS